MPSFHKNWREAVHLGGKESPGLPTEPGGLSAGQAFPHDLGQFHQDRLTRTFVSSQSGPGCELGPELP